MQSHGDWDIGPHQVHNIKQNIVAFFVLQRRRFSGRFVLVVLGFMKLKIGWRAILPSCSIFLRVSLTLFMIQCIVFHWCFHTMSCMLACLGHRINLLT